MRVQKSEATVHTEEGITDHGISESDLVLYQKSPVLGQCHYALSMPQFRACCMVESTLHSELALRVTVQYLEMRALCK